MHKTIFRLALGLLAFLPGLVWAQDINLDRSRPIVGRVDPADQSVIGGKAMLAPNTFGSVTNATWFGASKFTVILSAGAPTLTYDGSHYYNAPGESGPVRYFAQLDLDPGASVVTITPVFDDSSATNNMFFSLQKYVGDVSTGVFAGSTVVSASTTGTPGPGFINMSPATPETITTLSSFTLTNYYLAADIATDTRFAGMWVFWKRQVSPGPATATFGDVPTGSPQFKFVEAVVAAGVTAGCGGNNYCPNDPITRGQMAVFLSVALGLEFPR